MKHGECVALIDLAAGLPVVVALLKALMKLLVGQNPAKVASIKAVIAFPVDLLFLTYTYAIARMVVLEKSDPADDPARYYSVITIVFVVCALLVIPMCKAADDLQTAEKYKPFFFMFFMSCVMTFFPFVFAVTM